ncbi:hypothetical protein BJ508DRAFT_312646 [Ascobolus immersus RN42]|uniref:Uncharacterized protein n=1 Tax=Ascobolus immersus RN42 TaxID=1160509 RepID=A0A3N4HLI0_ASCIM|nr:hypothetical protein BJ508DRAFT_312646 [Ascobolus immersus RN42]
MDVLLKAVSSDKETTRSPPPTMSQTRKRTANDRSPPQTCTQGLATRKRPKAEPRAPALPSSRQHGVSSRPTAVVKRRSVGLAQHSESSHDCQRSLLFTPDHPKGRHATWENYPERHNSAYIQQAVEARRSESEALRPSRHLPQQRDPLPAHPEIEREEPCSGTHRFYRTSSERPETCKACSESCESIGWVFNCGDPDCKVRWCAQCIIPLAEETLGKADWKTDELIGILESSETRSKIETNILCSEAFPTHLYRNETTSEDETVADITE